MPRQVEVAGEDDVSVPVAVLEEVHVPAEVKPEPQEQPLSSLRMIAWEQYFEFLIFNGFFMALWVGSALLFRRAAQA